MSAYEPKARHGLVHCNCLLSGVKRTPALCTQSAGAVQRCSQPKRDFSLGTFEHCTGFLVGQGDGIHERLLLGAKPDMARPCCDVREYRKNAEHSEQEGKRALSSLIADEYLKLAKQWGLMAGQADHNGF